MKKIITMNHQENIVDKFNENAVGKAYRPIFTSLAEAQKYADYLNSKQ